MNAVLAVLLVVALTVLRRRARRADLAGRLRASGGGPIERASSDSEPPTRRQARRPGRGGRPSSGRTAWRPTGTKNVTPSRPVGLVPARLRPPARSPEATAVMTFPDTVDLLGVAAGSGLPAVLAVRAVAVRAPPPWDQALGAVAARVDRGSLFGPALAELSAGCGDPGRRLAAVLRAAADGADLAGALERLATDARDMRRRRAEQAARRVPVRLLAPLVLCALPAFVLLALVPLVVGAFEALRP